MRHPVRCDLFCRVVDNLGDAAVCWRLARQLAAEFGWRPRLWIDAPEALSRLVPGTRPGRMHQGVQIERWTEQDPRLKATGAAEVAQVVIAAFACNLPRGYQGAMRSARTIWLNLEYLSAESWVDSHHGLPSHKPDGGIEYFFFPGFSPASGGLLREADLITRRDAFLADPWARIEFLSSLGVTTQPGDRWASLFCYPKAPVGALLAALHQDTSGGRWRLLVPAGVNVGLVPERLSQVLITPIPFVPQRDYDTLLWTCELNWVRGEDSLVRALWSGRPFIWQAYRQQEEAHLAKLHALIEHWVTATRPNPATAQTWRSAMQAWNADLPEGSPPCGSARHGPDAVVMPGAPNVGGSGVEQALASLLQALPELRDTARRWSDAQGSHPDLASRLVAFVGERL